MKEWGWTMPVLIDEKETIIAGHARVMAGKKNGYPIVPVIVARGWTEAQKRAYIIADNQLTLLGGWNEPMLRLELGSLQDMGFDLGLIGFSQMELVSFTTTPKIEETRSLGERFGIVPFSVFNAREGVWQDRKKAWIALGIQSEIGRGENLLEFSDAARLDGGTYKARQAARSKKGKANASAA